MRRYGFLVFLTVATLFFSAQTALSETHKRITGDELQAMMKDGTQMTVVDVREPELFAAGHVPGALNIDYYDNAKTRILKLSRKDRIVFICHGGPMGDELSEILTANGYAKVYNVKGGMRNWDGPMEKGGK
ncbi:MAG: rhodanese-like domain-containing protein [Deltaproteobacteria bacterium]|nr:rhodanese-like domain-containing protein [Deltaproteobacteria bacterium]